MPTGAITGYIDVAQLVLYVFWVFFAGLIFYLRREDRREGYPLDLRPLSRVDGRRASRRSPRPRPSCCRMAARVQAPRGQRRRRPITAKPIADLARRAAAADRRSDADGVGPGLLRPARGPARPDHRRRSR